jgi:EmrB/QacA subfamily drug resistance transporter
MTITESPLTESPLTESPHTESPHTGGPHPPPIDETARARENLIHSRRWAILAVLCLSVFVTVVDGTIVNVALPSLAIDLGASTRQMQWIVDAYLLVFTGLLLAAGALGDRFGRKRALVVGLVLFGLTSAFAGSASSASELIAGRALMGIGAALIFPATLAILTNVFADPSERAKAIGVWSGVTGLAVAAGPITGGWLLEHFWWGSVFYINVPVVVVAVIAVVVLVPNSREKNAPRLDVVGLLLSITSIGALVLTIIEAPEWGWLSVQTFVGFIIAATLISTFIRWELRTAHPLLPVRIFRNLRFSAASVSITSAFFALFGFIFLVTQYFQLVRGYTPLESGVRTLPVAFSIAFASVLAPRVVERVGTTRVVMTGLASMAATFAWISTNSATTSYLEIVGQMILLGGGLGLTTAPATESIMGSLSVDKAGVGSAVNDTTRELGGTLGVAVVGSVFSSVYAGALRDGPAFAKLPDDAQVLTEESVGAAQIVAGDLGTAAPAYLSEVSDAFMSGFGVASLVVAFVAAFGALFAWKFLPARAADLDPQDHVRELEPIG